MVEKNDEVMFSVELTTYNQEDYIAQTLQSIIDQKHNYKYEILVSDDCSTDGTQSVIEDFYKKYPGIIKPVYNKKNLGAMNNYYATIARAKGKYIMGCGGDDYWLPGKVEKQITFMEENPGFGLCYSFAQTCNENGVFYDETIGSRFQGKKEILVDGNCVAALTSCVRKEFLLKYLEEIKPQNQNWYMEDYPLNIYAAFNTNIFYFDEALAVYRIVQNSLSHQINIQKAFFYNKSIWDIRNFFSKLYCIPIESWNDSLKLYEIYKDLEKKSLDKKELERLIIRSLYSFVYLG